MQQLAGNECGGHLLVPAISVVFGHFGCNSNNFWFLDQELVDIDVFQEAKKVIDALQNKDAAPALAWCAENKSRLKKSKVYTTV